MNVSKRFLHFLLNFWPIGRFLNWAGRKPPFSLIFQHWLSEQTNQAVIIPINETIQGTQSVILPAKLLLPLIEQAGESYIMDECLCRKAEGCQNYLIDIGCIFLGTGAARMHPSLSRRASVDEIIQHLDRATQAGLTPMVIHSAFDAFILGIPYHRMLAVCFCCDCCCTVRKGLQIGPPAFWDAVERLPGLEVVVDEELCTGCGACARACHLHAISCETGHAQISERCKGCGRCVVICPKGAIQIKVDGVSRMPQYLIEKFAEHTDIG